VAAVTREEAPAGEDDERPDHRQPHHEIPRRGHAPECLREVVPEDVLELVDEREEAGGDGRGGQADDRPEDDEA
jgi:hypothetical protein